MKMNSKEVKIGKIKIGGKNKIAVQSMLNIPSYNIEENVAQAIKLKEAGCDILRVAIPDMDAIRLIDAIKQKVNIPLVADIHFDHKLAIESVYAGADKIRINPGNTSKDKIKEIVKVCLLKGIPIRVGINSGSLEKHLGENLSKPQAMCESALNAISLLESYDFDNIVVSLKSSDVKTSIDSYRLISEKCDYPLHLGITESGTEYMGCIKSSIGIGSLLVDGIGDTIRVALTDDPIKEVKCGISILKALNLHDEGINLVSCPTCGRTRINLIDITQKAEKLLEKNKSNLKVAIMGCVVNGPGEAKDADIGIAGGDGIGVLFKKGKVIKKIREKDLLEELIKEINLISSN